MNIGIIGSGNVGGTLGTRWSALGHRVVFSSRNPQSDEMRKMVQEAGPGASAASVAEDVRGSDVLLVATPWPATQQAVQSAADISGKVLIDATNPLLPDLSGLSVGTTTSGAEQVASWAAGARVVKAFNTVGFNIMKNPKFAGSSAALFYCGDDGEAKRVVHQLASELGFDARDAGPLTQARLLEPFALLWISLAIKQGYGRDFGFQLMTR
jgi:predicted dinucleotide-binding enzyme